VQVAKSFRRATATGVEAPFALPDSIHVEQLEISARVGVTEAERSQPQRLTVSLTMWPRSQIVDLADNIQDTIDYSHVCDATKEFVRDRSYKLIETMADRLAGHLLKQFAVQRITIELRKFVVPDAKFVAVTITRNAAVG
jgi:dihydroneopterin aldolase